MPDFTTDFEMAIAVQDKYNNHAQLPVSVDKAQKLLRLEINGGPLTVTLETLEAHLASVKRLINMGPIHALADQNQGLDLSSTPG